MPISPILFSTHENLEEETKRLSKKANANAKAKEIKAEGKQKLIKKGSSETDCPDSLSQIK